MPGRRERTIFTIISDWGTGNHYAGSVKGALLKQHPDAVIIDITHRIDCYDIMQASFVLSNAWPCFPEGTIHLIAINTEGGMDSPHIAVQHKGQFFIGADNGIFSLLFQNDPVEALELNIIQDSDYFTFSTRDVFVKAAAMIASGKPLVELGQPYRNFKEKFMFNPVVYPDKIVGKVIFIDGYGNAFVNIDRDLFREKAKGMSFRISWRMPGDGITEIHESYSDVTPGEQVVLFGTTGLLEIAINQGKASSLLGIRVNDSVTVDFFKE
ncbi:MAG: hypothetical protein EA394_02335 [Bacteroidia bacterium]|nr:MAG: hypothetical protein EA394_02335 [Bacteroidia bacterium]